MIVDLQICVVFNFRQGISAVLSKKSLTIENSGARSRFHGNKRPKRRL